MAGLATRKKVTRSQVEAIVWYMENHPNFAIGSLNVEMTASTKRILWEKLTAILDAEVDGVVKSIEKWQRCWTDVKSEVKKRYQLYLKNPSKSKQPSELDQRIISLIGQEDGKIIKKELTGENNSKSVVPQDPKDDLGIKIAFYHSLETNAQDSASTQEIFQSSTAAPQQQSSEDIESAANPKTVDPPVTTASNKNMKFLSYQRKSAEALQAIAKELGVKNELTKRKLELEERKVQAFEIIAKKLQK